MTPTPASDVYSLGVTLYKLLTGQTAFKGQHLEEVKKKVIENTFPTPRSVLADIPRPLEAVCLKAMSLHPHQRYADASELARDIEHYLADERVSAYREPWTTTAMRWCRRRRSLAQGIVVGLVVILVAGTLVITSALHHREDLVQEKIERVKATATAEESILLSKIEGLEQDIRFLASRPQIQESLSLADDQDRKTELTTELTAIFRDFIDEKPSCMQARLINRNGMEVVRVERGKSGEPVNAALLLRDKSESQYFKDTMKLAVDEVYLSKLELNVEDDVKDWDFPVIRAAMPVFDEAQKCSGIVIINMHFSHLEKLVAASQKNDMLVYLTNEQGEYLLHPTQHIGFCFERKLDFRVQVTYPLLNPFINSHERAFEQTAVQPRISMLLERAPNKNVRGNSLNGVVKSIIQANTNLSSSFSEQGEDREFAVITNIQDESQANEIRNDINGNVVRTEVLPTRYRSGNQAIYCRKIFFDKRKPDRFILLVLVAPH